MAFKKTLVNRIFKISKITNRSLTNCRISNPAILSRIPNQHPNNQPSDPGDSGMFRRLFHKRAPFHQPPLSISSPGLGFGDNLIEKLRSIDISKDRIKLDGLIPPPPSPEKNKSFPVTKNVMNDDLRKLFKLAQMEVVKTRLREVENVWIDYSEFIRICSESFSDPETGIRVAEMLNENGSVLVLGNVIIEAIGGLIPLPAISANDPRRRELEELEKQKALIDGKAETLVRWELWGGLGYLVVQTAALMRLTFWELTWDVMEPICFYLTSMYFMAGYAFFLRTSKEPSFEGFYQSRFVAKQQKLMKLHNFDMEKYQKLRKICYPTPVSSSPGQASEAIAAFN